jgi:general secretion pathway protein G
MIVRQRAQKPVARTGFTLMEMLVVVAIIVALASIGGFFLLNTLHEQRISTAKLQARKLAEACEQYYLKHSQMPTQIQDLIDPAKGPILKESRAIIDPWGQPYQLDPSGVRNQTVGNQQVDIISVGSGQEIGNWN